MGFKYSVVSPTMGWIGYNVMETPREIMAAVAEAGYDGIDVPGEPKQMDGKEWRKMAEEAGMEVPEVLAAWAFHHAGEERYLTSLDSTVRACGIQYAKDTVELAAEIGARFVELCTAQTTVPQVPYPFDPISEMRKHFKESICEICDYAIQYNVTILLEPLNCYEGLPGVLTTVHEAVSYVEELKRDNLGVQPDNFHMNISESSIVGALRRAGGHIKHYHFNESNRAMHGTGHSPFKEIVRTLKDINYDGYIAMYMPLTTQRIFQSAPGAAMYGTRSAESIGESDDTKTLLEYVSQPLQLVKEIERLVDAERTYYELESRRY